MEHNSGKDYQEEEARVKRSKKNSKEQDCVIK